jgi:(p)ppGpp synthase/HD superfamily hydrolase
MKIEIRDLSHLEKVVRLLRGVDGVLDVERVATTR